MSPGLGLSVHIAQVAVATLFWSRQPDRQRLRPERLTLKSVERDPSNARLPCIGVAGQAGLSPRWEFAEEVRLLLVVFAVMLRELMVGCDVVPEERELADDDVAADLFPALPAQGFVDVLSVLLPAPWALIESGKVSRVDGHQKVFVSDDDGLVRHTNRRRDTETNPRWVVRLPSLISHYSIVARGSDSSFEALSPRATDRVSGCADSAPM
jgi:hypothetical protein